MSSVVACPVFSRDEVLRRRKAAELTRQALASRAGLSLTTLAAIETGRNTKPLIGTVSKLACALGCSVDDLLTPDAA